MEPDGVTRDNFLIKLVKIINDEYPNVYFVPKEQKDLIEQ